ncbi:MAG TPA: BTAD domain-containing putative transcriptional regulator [Longimicrobium sp.]|nr:BTAD domain-containing putative transcriptional regulator [Longimicrobium sp.]
MGRERIIALLWPEHASDAARHTLSESLYVLRKELGAGVFVAVGDEIGLAAEVVRSDVAAFEEALEAGRLEAAVGEYRGPLLDGFYVSDAPEFERWVDGERDRLARACAGALERLATEAETDGRPMDAVEWWRRAAAHDPYSSRVALRLVQALDGAGERASALRAATAHGARMREELGVEPDAALSALVASLRAEPPPRPAPTVRPAPPPPLADDLPAVAPVDGEEPHAEVIESPSIQAPMIGTPAIGPAPIPPRSSFRRRYTAAALAAVALVAALAVGGRWGSEPEPARYDPRRIAVLYFDDDSPGGELQYLANALTGELIDELSQVAALDVISRNGVKGYRDGDIGFDSLVAGLRVGSVVEGSVQRSGDSVRVTVQLVDTNRKAHLESRTIIHPLGDLFSLERAVGEEVSGFLRRRLGEEIRLGQTAAETRSAAALGLVLRAEGLRDDASRLVRRHHPLDARSAGALLLRADSLLAGAQAADPAWARPTVLRGSTDIDRSALAWGAERRRLVRSAVSHAEAVLAREPRHARALELRGRALLQAAGEGADAAGADTAGADTAGAARRLELAERDLRAAVEADSTQASGWAALSQLLRLRGRFAESDLAARRALEQDAWLEDADAILKRLYFAAMAQGDYPAARRNCGDGHAQFPGDWRFVECRLTLLREDPGLRPDAAEAWKLVAELDRLDPPARAREAGRPYSPLFRRVAVAAVLARAGDGDSARAVLARARAAAAADSELRIPFLFDAAYVHLLLGDRAGARRLLEEYLVARPALRPYVARDILFRDLFPAPRR